MFQETFDASAKGGAEKVRFLKENPLGYLMASLLGGAYLGFGILLTYTISGWLGDWPARHIIMGASFGVALSLVIICGAEMFTGNAFVLYNSLRLKLIHIKDVGLLWLVCYGGNWLGAVILSLLFYGAGYDTGTTAEAIKEAAVLKMNLPPLELFLRGILCNILVCLAIWSSFRCRSDAGKLIMTFWCLYVFYTLGFEHCIANMTVMTLALLLPAVPGISLAGYAYNLLFVTLGNIVGAIVFLSIPYGLAAYGRRK